MRLIFKVFFQIVCCSQSTLKSPHWSESKQNASSLSLCLFLSPSLYQHCLYLLYRSVRGAVRENTRERGERQSIVQGRKSTGVDGAPVSVCVCVGVSACIQVCACVGVCLITVIVLDKHQSFILKGNCLNLYTHAPIYPVSCIASIPTYAFHFHRPPRSLCVRSSPRSPLQLACRCLSKPEASPVNQTVLAYQTHPLFC